MTKIADVYFDMALKVIPLAESADDLRSWWDHERDRRREYELSRDQIDDLVEACKDHVRSLGEKVRE